MSFMGMKAIPTEKVDGIAIGDISFLWYCGEVRKVKVTNTYNHPEGILVDYQTKCRSGNRWVDVTDLFDTEKNCLLNHITDVRVKYERMMKGLLSDLAKLE